jgi:hypothetical protein
VEVDKVRTELTLWFPIVCQSRGQKGPCKFEQVEQYLEARGARAADTECLQVAMQDAFYPLCLRIAAGEELLDVVEEEEESSGNMSISSTLLRLDRNFAESNQIQVTVE